MTKAFNFKSIIFKFMMIEIVFLILTLMPGIVINYNLVKNELLVLGKGQIFELSTQLNQSVVEATENFELLKKQQPPSDFTLYQNKVMMHLRNRIIHMSNNGVIVGIYDKNGVVLYHTDNRLTGKKLKSIDAMTGELFIQNVLITQNNFMEYAIQNPAGRGVIPKIAYVQYNTAKEWYIVVEKNKDVYLGIISRVSKTSSVLLLVTFIITLCGSYLITRYFTKPIFHLIKASQKISKGDLSHRAQIKSRDEFGELAASFNDMISNLQKVTVSVNYVNNILKTIQDSLIVTDFGGIITTVNQATEKLLGYNETEITGQSIENIFATSEIPVLDKIYEASIQHQFLAEIETVFSTKEQKNIPVSIAVSILYGLEDEPQGIVLVSRDLTERKAVETALKKTQQQLIEIAHRSGMAEIATDIVHNIGNILNSVNISSEIILETLKQTKLDGLLKATQLLQEHETDLGDYITHDPRGKLLPKYYIKVTAGLKKEYSKLESETNQLLEKIKIIKEIVVMEREYTLNQSLAERINLAVVVENTLKIQYNSLSLCGIKIHKKYHTHENNIIHAQKSKLVHVLLNILNNARDALRQNKDIDKWITIEIGRSRKGDTYIRIADNGEGIPPENLNSIFNHGFTTRENQYGFGLHSCANMMTEMGGRITAESAGAGKGATFTLAFPVYREQTLKGY